VPNNVEFFDEAAEFLKKLEKFEKGTLEFSPFSPGGYVAEILKLAVQEKE
jgi:hypothetical protein